MKGDRGFAFVEVLVALALLGTGMLLFVRSSLLALRLQQEGRSISTALTFAQEDMERLVAHGWDGAAGECLAEEIGDTRWRCLKERESRGSPYRLVLERKEFGPFLELLTVGCSPAGEEFSRRQVRLVTLRRPGQ